MKEKITAVIPSADQPYIRALAAMFIMLSFPLYGMILWVPFAPFPPEIKIFLSAGLFVASEIAFWGGVMVLGKEVVDRYKVYFSISYWMSLFKD